MNALVPVSAIPPMTIPEVERVALAIARGGLFGSSEPNAVLTLCLLAQAEGQHPAVVFRDYHIIKGKPAKKSEAMLRDFITSGGKVEWHTLDDTCADATFSHPGGGTVRISWDHERAKKAKVVNDMYQKYPRQMLRSRVISEGVRTVYPGATSGLYVPEEAAAMDDRAPGADTIDLTPGGEPEPPREKVPGITKIKARLNKLMRDGDAATDLAAFNALVGECKEELSAIRDANHDYWLGDGGDSEGFKAWIVRRRDELAQPEESTSLQFLLSLVAECDTVAALQNLMSQHGDAADALDGEEARRFERAFNDREAAVAQLDRVTAGA